MANVHSIWKTLGWSFYISGLLYFFFAGAFFSWIGSQYKEPEEARLSYHSGKITEVSFPRNKHPGLQVDLVYNLYCSLDGWGECSACAIAKRCNDAGKVRSEEAFGSAVQVGFWPSRRSGGMIYSLRVDGKLVFDYQDAIQHYRRESRSLLQKGLIFSGVSLLIMLAHAAYFFRNRRSVVSG
ncbi:hypothetical protein [Chromobacterium paludis]|uniref:Uncharacterized protein n=1 Tax=Chromobacterium paludis TaxID=2605945 RepID=A0A5C1DNG2_9NEIS|nr:hypothetical protein [Chromobacterium paludis]QEL57627.1 hypothetical protein FYK34_19650 [Chromobacterium paludis]